MAKFKYNDEELDLLKDVIRKDLETINKDEIKAIYKADIKRKNGDWYNLMNDDFMKLSTELRIKIIEKEFKENL